MIENEIQALIDDVERTEKFAVPYVLIAMILIEVVKTCWLNKDAFLSSIRKRRPVERAVFVLLCRRFGLGDRKQALALYRKLWNRSQELDQVALDTVYGELVESLGGESDGSD